MGGLLEPLVGRVGPLLGPSVKFIPPHLGWEIFCSSLLVETLCIG